MLRSSDITLPGFYWYFDAIGGPPVVVEVGPGDASQAGFEVRFAGREEADLLRDLSGDFIGPLVPPLG